MRYQTRTVFTYFGSSYLYKYHDKFVNNFFLIVWQRITVDFLIFIGYAKSGFTFK